MSGRDGEQVVARHARFARHARGNDDQIRASERVLQLLGAGETSHLARRVRAHNQPPRSRPCKSYRRKSEMRGFIFQEERQRLPDPTRRAEHRDRVLALRHHHRRSSRRCRSVARAVFGNRRRGDRARGARIGSTNASSSSSSRTSSSRTSVREKLRNDRPSVRRRRRVRTSRARA